MSGKHEGVERVLGLTSTSVNSIAVNPVTGEVCYIAGCFAVIYNPKENKQAHHIQSKSQQPLKSVCYSADGKYLAMGESAFKKAEINIYQIESAEEQVLTQSIKGDKLKNVQVTNYTFVKRLQGHKFGVEALRFSPDSAYLVSVGDSSDKGLFVWRWEDEKKVASNKLSKVVSLVEFSEQQDFFVTAGYQHLKFWYFYEQTK
jgi:WD40 repeat protein